MFNLDYYEQNFDAVWGMKPIQLRSGRRTQIRFYYEKGRMKEDKAFIGDLYFELPNDTELYDEDTVPDETIKIVDSLWIKLD